MTEMPAQPANSRANAESSTDHNTNQHRHTAGDTAKATQPAHFSSDHSQYQRARLLRPVESHNLPLVFPACFCLSPSTRLRSIYLPTFDLQYNDTPLVSAPGAGCNVGCNCSDPLRLVLHSGAHCPHISTTANLAAHSQPHSVEHTAALSLVTVLLRASRSSCSCSELSYQPA